jgi:hypothetical protein
MRRLTIIAVIAAAVLGATVGMVLVALGTRIGLDLTNVDSGVAGIAAVGVFTGIGHAIGEYGKLLWHGKPKPAAQDGSDARRAARRDRDRRDHPRPPLRHEPLSWACARPAT